MTKIETYKEIIAILEQATGTEDHIALIENEIELIEKKAEKAKAKRAEKANEPDEVYFKVLEALTSEHQLIANIAETAGESVGKVTNRLTKLCADGKAEKSFISVEGSKTKRAAYKVL